MVLFEAGHTGCNVRLVLSGGPHKIIMEALVCPAESLKEELVFLKITYMYNLKGCVEKSPKWHLENFEVTSIETPLSHACSLVLSSLLSKRTSNNNLIMLVLFRQSQSKLWTLIIRISIQVASKFSKSHLELYSTHTFN